MKIPILIEGKEVELEKTDSSESEDKSKSSEGKSPSASAGGSEATSLEEQMHLDADQVLSQYVFKHAAKIIGAESITVESATVLAGYFPRGVMGLPIISNNRKFMSHYFPYSFTSEEARMLLRNLGGDSLVGLDVYQDPHFLQSKEFLSLLPETGMVNKLLANNQYGNGCLYTAIFALPPILRSIPALALHSRKSNNDLLPYDANINLLLAYSIPTLKEMAEVAGKYKVRELKPTLEGLAKAKNLFMEKW